MILLKVHPHIKEKILENFTPTSFKLADTDFVEYKMYKDILKSFGLGFHTLQLKQKDISINYFHFCQHHNFYRYLKKIQKYCPNLTRLELEDISLGCLEAKRDWPVLSRLKQVSIKFNGRRIIEEIDEMLKHLKNLESIELYNVDLSLGWSRELSCPNLKNVTVYYKTNSVYGDRLISYIDWQNLFETHENIEQWHCNYPVYRGTREELKFNNLKQITFSTLSPAEAKEWTYLKNAVTLHKVGIITNHVGHVLEVIEQILQNSTIRTIEITETMNDLEISLPRDREAHENLILTIARFHQVEIVILNTRYYRYLQKIQLRSTKEANKPTKGSN